jgi:hypothetical protein
MTTETKTTEEMVAWLWVPVSDHDPRAAGLYSRHYSSAKNKKTIRDWLRHGISGPGEHLVLLAPDSRALFGWIKQIRKDNQDGVNCFVFRNEGPRLSSELIIEACKDAWAKWPKERLWTYVNPTQVSSANPGYCFKRAGWRYAGQSLRGLHVLECQWRELQTQELIGRAM